MARSQNPPEVGTRYRHRDVPYIVWEAVEQYAGVDGLPYVVLRNVSDFNTHGCISVPDMHVDRAVKQEY